ncbi:MAG: endo-1,4-beta-xylanase [Spirochaetales bacterium]|nr:endo-1,4-beta-xylanase [Spirochaetales bacterium]
MEPAVLEDEKTVEGIMDDLGVEKLKKQGTYYYQVMETVLNLIKSGTKVTAFSFCGFKDDLSWLGMESGGAPVLYDVNGREKYSYFGALQMRDLSGFDD